MRLRLLTLNLHCWQEPDAERKLDRVAELVAAHEVDVVCLQEVGQRPGRPDTNAARVIVGRLAAHGLTYDWVWDWAHIGFDDWQEGLAVIVRGEICSSSTAFLSNSHDRAFWKTRLGLFAELRADCGAELSVVNAHLGWHGDAEEPFESQWGRLVAGARELSGPTFVLGDLNQPAGGAGHSLISATPGVRDCDLLGEPTFPGDIAGWEGHEGARIDYVLRLGAGPEPSATELHFTGVDAPMVSDHFALCVDFEWPEAEDAAK